ncbi:MAG TPA: caspase family protein [Thermoanaerobaculia bacterium]|nr:caspase family protein [Thermoanaerobaculia bacterium]
MDLRRSPRPAARGSRTAAALLVLAAALLAALPAPGAAAEVRRYALLIGIGDYPQWPPLANPVPDVRALAAMLRQRYGFTPEVLENPDRDELLGQIRRYASLEYGPDDELVIVFAGHGTYDELTRIGYLAGRDAANRQRDPSFTTLIDYPSLLTLLDRLPAPKVLLAVDACFAGRLESGGRAGGGSATPRVRRYLTSGGTGYVSDGAPGGHSPFMRQLLEALDRVPAGKALALADLQRVFMSRLEPPARGGRFGSDAGAVDFVFRAREAPPPPAAAAVAARQSPGHDAAGVAIPAPPRLRAAPSTVAEPELKRILDRHDLFELAWNPEGDFPNQFRVQERGLWEVVLDLESNLMWQQGGSSQRMGFEAAQAYVAELNTSRHGGFADWRLPTVEELASLLEPNRLGQGLYLSPLFAAEQETCWTVDRDRDSGDPYYVSFLAGRLVMTYGGREAFVRAVRNP